MQRRPAGSLTRSILGLCLAIGAAGPGVAHATADTFALATDVQLVGQTNTVVAAHDDTLTDIARVHGLGYEEIVWANRKVDIWLPGEGTSVVLPKSFILPGDTREGVVVNIEQTVASIQRAVEEAEQMAGVDISTVYAGIAGGHTR